MNDDFGWFIFTICVAGMIYVGGFIMGENSASANKNKVIYCVEQPEKCKIEYQYIKLKEKNE